ncbi:MAG TPA: NUDIX domain-containing protein [Candidatus Paceibacterota bacterium]
METWLSDSDYNFIFSRVPRPCVDIIIRSAEGIILSLRDIEPSKSNWHMPGGMVYKGERLKDAVVRIAKKETGLDVKGVKFLGYMEFLSDGVVENVPRHSVSFVFEAKSPGGEFSGDFQSTDIQSFRSLPTNLHPIHKKFFTENNIFNP